MSSAEMDFNANKPWNVRGRVPLLRWLNHTQDEKDKERLKTVGNLVMPACGRLAMHIMLRQHQA